MTEPTTLTGSCHCGAISVTLQATVPPADLEVRACQCSFCSRHGAKTVSDPAGSCRFEIDGAALSWYRFETRTGMTLICNRCGTYAGAIIEDGDKVWSVLNARGLAIAELRDRTPVARVYEGETAEERIARRKAMWTPTEIVWCGGNAS